MKRLIKRNDLRRNITNDRKSVVSPKKKSVPLPPPVPKINIDIHYCNKLPIPETGSLRIGILTIATGRYIKYANPLYDSIRKNFLVNHKKTFVLFTDSEQEFSEDVKIFIIEKKGFPGDTLFRYHYFLSQKEYLLEKFDFLYYIDIDMLITDKVGNEVIPLKSFNKLIGVCHPGFTWNKILGSFENNKKSTAYISSGVQTIYYAGGFNGGDAKNFLLMAETIKKNIDKDSEQEYIAIWHDESHLNKYFYQYNPLTLDPGYCYPESWNIPFKKKIIALDKNHEEIRS
jgi:hypothetical protein